MDASVQTSSVVQEPIPERVSNALWPYWLILVSGVVVGVVLVCLRMAEPLPGSFPLLFLDTGMDAPLSFGSVMADSELRQSGWLFLAALLGFFSLAAPVLWLLIFLRGLGIGYAVGSCLAIGAEGLLSAVRVLLPGVLSVFVFLYACRESRLQSAYLCRCFFWCSGDQRMGLYGYLFRYAVYFALSLVCAAAEAACVLAFSQIV